MYDIIIYTRVSVQLIDFDRFDDLSNQITYDVFFFFFPPYCILYNINQHNNRDKYY